MPDSRGHCLLLPVEKHVFGRKNAKNKRRGRDAVKISLMLGSSQGTLPEDAAISPPTNSPGSGAKRRPTRYEVQERLGEGALWIVYRVRAAPSGKNGRAGTGASLALKALRGAANRHARLPLALNAAAAHWHELSHPHLATPLEWGVESGTTFFTSKLLSGGSLHSRLERGPLGSDEAMQLLRSLANALTYLHGKDLVHGDIRPRQILFDSSGFPLLTDGGQAGALVQAGLTLSDLQPDTALFLAPERSAGSAPTPASDVYSLGVTFYAALTGRVPFEASSPLAIAARHRHETPAAPSSLNPSIPREMDVLALRLLSKNAEERPSAFELERLLAPRAAPIAATAPPVAEDAQADAPEEAPAPPAKRTKAPKAAIVDVQPLPAPPKAPKRRRLDDLVQQTLNAQDEEARKKAMKKLKKRHVWREFGGMLGAIFFLLLLVGAGVGGALWAYDSVLAQIPKQVIVPSYLGKTQDKAKLLLAKAGLTLKVTRESYDPKVPAGTVMDGDPEPGREVRARREVFVTVSAGQAPIKMVDFSQLTLDQARTIILQHGMKLGSIAEQYDDKTPHGAVIGQYPEPGDSFSRAQAITLVVSRGPQPKELDAQNGEFVLPDPLADAPPAPAQAPFDTGEGFAPLEPASGSPAPGQTQPDGQTLETRSARVSVSIPKGGGTQLVRIIVRDAKGERTVYQKAGAAGTQFKKQVTVSRAVGQKALVRVYVGETLATEDQI